MRCHEIKAGSLQGITQIGLTHLMATERRRDQPRRIKPADEFPEGFELVYRNKTLVAHVTLVGEVEVPVAIFLERHDNRLHGTLVRFEVRQAPAGRRTGASERHVNHQPASIALRQDSLEFFQMGFVRDPFDQRQKYPDQIARKWPRPAAS